MEYVNRPACPCVPSQSTVAKIDQFSTAHSTCTHVLVVAVCCEAASWATAEGSVIDGSSLRLIPPGWNAIDETVFKKLCSNVFSRGCPFIAW